MGSNCEHYFKRSERRRGDGVSDSLEWTEGGEGGSRDCLTQITSDKPMSVVGGRPASQITIQPSRDSSKPHSSGLQLFFPPRVVLSRTALRSFAHLSTSCCHEATFHQLTSTLNQEYITLMKMNK